MTKKRPGPAPGVRFIEVSVLQKCQLRESWLYTKTTIDHSVGG